MFYPRNPVRDKQERSASQSMYNYTDEYKDFLQDTGTCVINNFIGMYGEKLKLTRDAFITITPTPIFMLSL
jgi:hypothetical protein